MRTFSRKGETQLVAMVRTVTETSSHNLAVLAMKVHIKDTNFQVERNNMLSNRTQDVLHLQIYTFLVYTVVNTYFSSANETAVRFEQVNIWETRWPNHIAKKPRQ